MPTEAEETLLAYWQSLPSSSDIEYQINRAWPGETTGAAFSTSPAGLEVWCVESEINSSQEQNLDAELLTWIVFRESENADWSAYLLAAMSSTWPYEACQDGIPGY